MSKTKNPQISRRYAEALFAAIPAQDRRMIADELKQVLTVLEDPKIHEVFTHPRTSAAHKNELIRLMKLSRTLENFLLLSVEKSREQFLPSIERHFESLVLEAEQTTIAQIVSAIPLTSETLDGLKQRLQQLAGKTVRLNTSVDPRIGGGIIIKIDGKVIDGSVSHSLNLLQRSLTS